MATVPYFMNPSKTGNISMAPGGATIAPGGSPTTTIPRSLEDQALYDRLLTQGYSEEEIEGILTLASLQGEEDILSQQMEYADTLRKTENPEGLNPTGRVYTAANPLQHLSAGMDRVYGGQEASRVEEAQRDVMDRQMQARMDFLRNSRASAPPVDTPIPYAMDPSKTGGR
jgi:hypothetical protein